MSEIEKAIKGYLKTNLSCDSVNEGMNKLSKYSLDKKINEELFIKSFIEYCIKYFLDEIIEFQRNNKTDKIELSVEEIFKLSHQILINHEGNLENKKPYERILLLYKTFFFIELDENNETNDFTFYLNLPKHLIKEEDYELYMLNIGMIILNSEDSLQLIEVLFSLETPGFLKNVILTCFEYIRSTKKTY